MYESRLSKEVLLSSLDRCRTDQDYMLKIYDKYFVNMLGERRVELNLIDELSVRNFGVSFVKPLANYLKGKLGVSDIEIKTQNYNNIVLLLYIDDIVIGELDVVNKSYTTRLTGKVEDDGYVKSLKSMIDSHMSNMGYVKETLVYQNTLLDTFKVYSIVCRLFMKKDLDKLIKDKEDTENKIIKIKESINSLNDTYCSYQDKVTKVKGLEKTMTELLIDYDYIII